jgi:coproporphyrinogen III oxidase-like Fe-S oxidoreductase
MEPIVDRSAISRLLKFYEGVTLRRNLFTPPAGFSTSLPYESAELVRDTWDLYLESNAKARLSLYLHIPFCAAPKCTFCMYYSRPMPSPGEVESYLHYLECASDFFSPVMVGTSFESLYVGGGTPSILSLDQLEYLFEKVVCKFEFHVEAECTFENSFQTCSRDKLKLLHESGINRVSFGLESVEETVLAAVNRQPSDEAVVRDQVGFARLLGFAEVNVDLLIGLPGETAEGVARGLELAVEAGADSVTIYVYRHQAAVSEATLAQYNRETVPRILNAARGAASRLGWRDTVQNDHTEYQFFSAPRHLKNYSLLCYRTRPDPLCGNSTLGLGHTAASFVADFFRAECRDKDSNFDPRAKSWVIGMIVAEHRRRLFVLESLNREGFVEDNCFRSLFGVDLRHAFSEEISMLEEIGKGELKRGRLVLAAKDRLELATLSKFFWDQKYLRQLAGKPS